MKKTLRLYKCTILILVLLASFAGCSGISLDNPTLTTKDNDMKIHFLDVGQGDCTLIVSGGHAMLIDAGNNDKGTMIQDYLTKLGIKKLDYVIGTHPDADHIGGLDVVLYKFDCETIILPNCDKDTATYDDVLQTMKHKHYKKTLPRVGATYELGYGSFTILAPNDAYGDNANEYSVGVLLCHGDNKFVFTGDAEEKSEEDILKNGIDISANVYKVSHHGSKSASTTEFLEAMNPEFAVISCGEGNSYGHPHAQTLNTLRKMGVRVFRTDEQGGIVATSDGKSITWNCSPSETWQVGEGGKSDREDAKWSEEVDLEKAVHVIEGMNYIINTNTRKFHNPSCTSVGEMLEKNRQETTWSKEELVRQGYTPCGRCKP